MATLDRGGIAVNAHLFLRRVGLMVRREIERLNRHYDFADPDLCGACGIASWTLHKILGHLSIQNEIVMGHVDGDEDADHVWLEVPSILAEPAILDVTATQFGITPLVVLAPLSDPLTRRFAPRLRGKAVLKDFREWGSESPWWYKKDLEKIVHKTLLAVSEAA